LSKVEKSFEAIRKNDKDYKKTLKRDSFRKPIKKASTSEQVGPISISNSKRRSIRMICNNIKKHHHNNKILPRSRFQRNSTFQTRSATRKEISK
jgi:hypothetical protein